MMEVELEDIASKKHQQFELFDDALFNLNFVPKLNAKEKVLPKNKREST